MKIIIVSKSDLTGGAAIAAKRLKDALHAESHDVNMLVQEKLTNDELVVSTGKSVLKKYYNFVLFLAERLYFYFYEKSKAVRFGFSPTIAGEDISKHYLVKEAAIIHLHWFNQGYLSLKNLKKLIKLNKPIVWTLHDMWAFTGGCHYSGNCENYRENCGNCKFLVSPGKNDLSARILKKKRKIIEGTNIQFVACSKWLAQKARESSLLKGFEIKPIPNPIDTSVFNPVERTVIRQKLGLPVDKKLILFGSANIMDERKGLIYLLEALKKVQIENPELSDSLEIVLFGKSNQSMLSQIPFKVNNLGVLRFESELAEVYCAVDVFVLPSLEDNLPNTIMESLACGTPVVAFKTGGIPEMIDHQLNGYLADFKSVDDLTNGLNFILQHENPQQLSENCLKKVFSVYTQSFIVNKYQKVYEKAIQDLFATGKPEPLTRNNLVF